MEHTPGRNKEHGDEDKLKLTVFNLDKQGQAGQARGVTSRPDSTNYTDRNLNTQVNYR